MNKEDLALNNLQWLVCHETQPNPTKPIYLEKKNILLYPAQVSLFFFV